MYILKLISIGYLSFMGGTFFGGIFSGENIRERLICFICTIFNILSVFVVWQSL